MNHAGGDLNTHILYTHSDSEVHVCLLQPMLRADSLLWWKTNTENRHTHIRSSCIEVYTCFWQPHAPLACFVWANQQMASFPAAAKKGAGQMTEKGKNVLNVWEGERDQTTYYGDVSLLTVRQTGERCHTRWTNRKQRNGATYDINAGMGWELPAWGSFPMSRQTAWAHSINAIQKHNPHAVYFII